MQTLWWLLDQEKFIDEIKKEGFNSIKFKEDSHIKKTSGDSSAHTYLVFNPQDIIVKSDANSKIKTLEDLLDYLNSSG